MKSSAQLRESYLAFFESKTHLRLPSASLIPVNDPTLLLIGAGMAPFKSYFRGEEKPPHTRITTCQKCLRADDENVGVTARHHTFFEMLGNFSFGDYFKVESCQWAWEYLTGVLGLDGNRLWVTIHPDDDVAHGIWAEQVGVPVERISRLEDNFWGPIGATGPCGPCSEIYYDQGGHIGCGREACRPGCNCDRFLEIWNLVFTGLNKEEDGSFSELPRPCIDTGMGLERLTFLMQGKLNPYETDLFAGMLEVLRTMSGHSLDEGGRVALALKIICDHTRGVIFLLSDGISPSNEGKGYVLRRLLRRAMRFGRVLGIETGFLETLVPPVVATYGDVYPELRTRETHVTQVLLQEQASFLRTLEQGSTLLETLLGSLTRDGLTRLAGTDVFRLYDTYGFPLELTREMAAERGFEIDVEGFEAALEAQRERSRADLKERLGDARGQERTLEDVQPTRFVGYEALVVPAVVLRLFRDGVRVDSLDQGQTGEVLLDVTSFYAEGGGQVGDQGSLIADGVLVQVTDTRKGAHDTIVHHVTVGTGRLQTGAMVTAQVDTERREATMRHHTGTHLLQAALRRVLGEHITQTGSSVSPERLRFDFSHYAPLTPEQLHAVERLVNQEILRNVLVDKREMSMEEARTLGALAFFEEKYSDRVRVVTMESFSRELCGGTHCARTGDIGTFKITSESAIAAGQRRIEAVCGLVALEAFRTYEQILRSIGQEVKASPHEIGDALGRLKDSLQRAEREIGQLSDIISAHRADEIARSAAHIGEVRFVAAVVHDVRADGLEKLGDSLRTKLHSGVVVLGASDAGKARLACWISKDLVERGLHAGTLIKTICEKVGGKGGGRPDFAKGGGDDTTGLDAAMAAAQAHLEERLGARVG